ncbi:stage II sporulation protein M [Neobacillus sp. OS1-2]|uniref:stage II sporulation protein M n=1 Tax=Neobacillus sp. OS1-2 TaxID=3070680 RepID=UPI0027DF8E70|nr:stage II sporulation protein M [Neobacillus sp. OS1-2]WML41612.1 stage II sporulation protein M [Neobacillus sp. OS1-2]
MSKHSIKYSNLLYFFTRGNKKYLLITIIIFLVVFYISYFGFSEILKDDIKDMEGTDYKEFKVDSFLDFFINNSKVFLCTALGLGFITFFSLLYQAYSLGMLYSLWIHQGLSIKTFALLTIPHGIFEIPALFIAGAIGFRSFTLLIHYLRKKDLDYRKNFEQISYNLILMIFLTFLAALVEYFVTQKIV